MKKEKIWFFKRGYDFFTLKEDLLVLELKYNIDEEYKEVYKDVGYFMAKLLKNIKKLKIIKIIKEKKKNLREKGWKI